MKKRPFIIDCDTGTDDAIAIIAALCSPQVEVKAITSVNGNVNHGYTSRNNLDLVEYLGLDLPVAKGAVQPMMSGFVQVETTDLTHGRTGMGDLELPRASRSRFDGRIASQLIYDTAVELEGELELLVIGPMTNIAVALLQYPDLPGLVKHIWFMGGAAKGGNVTPTAEFNIWADPEAAQVVIRSGIPMTMVGLDVTEKAIMVEEDAQKLRTAGTREGEVVALLLEYMFRRRDAGGENALMHDALAFAAAVCPECLTFEENFVDVECRGQYTYGHTFVDRRKKTGKAPNVSVALGLDTPVFRKWLVDTVLNGVQRG